ncbi:hypothetical protein LTR37_003267 [Vermiconidia calcicola]|uniref:Uncharacterized protein n=1 Tax=Vermiconidia calcicola TaxID=1690605 RepID=A0ACC3NR31_9PEZI|nr:hypothetical protein LTR37_003267 [Vermiconidia calcicola]
MSRYNSGFYDPVGSQANQPAGYTYQPPTSGSTYPSATSSSGYGSNYQQGYGSSNYNNQQYGLGAQQQQQTTNSSASHAAAALSSLSNQGYSQTSSAHQNRRSSSGQYDNPSWINPGTNSSTYSSSNLALPNRTQSNNSPLCATQSTSTFGRLSVPDQPQSSSNTAGTASTYQNAPSSAGASGRSYQASSYTQQQPQSQPPRYNSPLHAIQAQQHSHNKQSSRSSNQLPSPQIANAGQQSRQSASVEPSPTTVDPSQVYDNRAELQRKAQFEAEKRRKYEAEQADKAEQERLAEEKRKAEEEKQKAEAEAAAEKKKVEQQRKNEQRKKAREEKKQSKSAATALQQMASTGAGPSEAPPGETDEEAEMRLMFKKMREFNAKNPAMLAKLWDEERKTHESTKTSPASAAKTPARPTTAQQKSQRAALSAISSSNQKSPAVQQPEVRPFTKPAPSSKAVKAGSSAAAQKAAQQSPAQRHPSQARSSPTQAATSLWPPHKKGAIAEATTKYLLSLPQNAGKSISAETVLGILNRNPPYVQLCESLEGFNLKFERSALARELLKAVPDGLKTQGHAVQKLSTPFVGPPTQANASLRASLDSSKKSGGLSNQELQSRANQLTTGAAAPNTVSYEAPLSLSDAAREINSMHRPPPINTHGSPVQQTQQSPYFVQPQPLTNGSRPPSQPQPPAEVKPEVPEEPPRPPANKEEAARKRTFGDLVDLTAEDSEDEAPPPKKLMRQPPPPNGPVNGVNKSQQWDPFAYSQKPPAFKQYVCNDANKPAPSQGILTQSTAPQAQMGGGPHAVPGQPQRPNSTSTPPIQQRPQLPPQQPQAPPRPRGPFPEQLQLARMKGKMLVEPIMRDRVARKSAYDRRTIARDVLLATGRHPDMRGLNGHLATMQKLLGTHGGENDSSGNRSDLATIRWDYIDPVPPAKAKEGTIGKESAALDADRERFALGRPTAAAKQLAAQRVSPAIVDYETPASSSKVLPSKKRRGRPAKTSLSAVAESSLTNGIGDTSTPRAASTQGSASRPATPASAPNPTSAAGAMASAGTPVGYSSFRQILADGTKKKGRPFGWRKNVHSREAQGLPTGSHPTTKVKEKPKQQSQEPGQTQVEPKYQVYKCEWAGCKSKLHNLDTLKKHILKVHGKSRASCGGWKEEYDCLWKNCRAAGEEATFGDIEGWIGHVDQEHLKPIAWRLGDGPRSVKSNESVSSSDLTDEIVYFDSLDSFMSLHSDSETTPVYLNDAYGRNVTPIISPAPPPAPQPQPSSTPAPTSQQPTLQPSQPTTQPSQPPISTPLVRGRGRPPKDGIPQAVRDVTAAAAGGASDAELKKLEEQKRAVGPTMGRMGCVLVDDGRREGFLDDEEFEDTVWEDEGE